MSRTTSRTSGRIQNQSWTIKCVCSAVIIFSANAADKPYLKCLQSSVYHPTMDDWLTEILADDTPVEKPAATVKKPPTAAKEAATEVKKSPTVVKKPPVAATEVKKPVLAEVKKLIVSKPPSGIVMPRFGEISIIKIGPDIGKTVTASPSEAKSILQSDDVGGAKLVRRISTVVDGIVFTYVCHEVPPNKFMGLPRSADMGCGRVEQFHAEIAAFRKRGSTGYIISTSGPPFGSRVEIRSVPAKSAFVTSLCRKI